MSRHSGKVGRHAVFWLTNRPSFVEGLAGGQQIAPDRSLNSDHDYWRLGPALLTRAKVPTPDDIKGRQHSITGQTGTAGLHVQLQG